MPSLLPLADVAALAARAGEQIAHDDAHALAVLGMASSLVRSYVGKTWESELVPDAAAQVTADVAFRAWSNPEGLIADAIDDGSRRWSERAAEGFYLTAANRTMLDSLRSTRRGLWTLGTTRGDDVLDTIYVPTGPAPSGDPIPFYAADDPLIQP